MSTDRNGAARPALTLKSLTVTRTEGIPHPFRIDGLGPSINLIYGPNGIGKSRTAEAIQSLLWPTLATPRTELLALLRVDDDEWRVIVDGCQTRYQREGVTVDADSLVGVPVSDCDRYLLTLHDLLQADNQKFARAIQKEAAGGYDLGAIRTELRLAARPKPQPSQAGGAYRKAIGRVEELRRRDRQLHEEERSLQSLEQALDRSIASGQIVRLLELAREHADADEQLKEAELARAAFPDPIGSMRGDEHADIMRRQGELNEALEHRRMADLEIERCRRELDATGFGDGIPSGSVIADLRSRAAALRDLEGDLRQRRELVAGHLAKRDACRARIGADITDAQLRELDEDGLRRLSALMREVHAAEALSQAEDELWRWLGTTEAPRDLERLTRAVAILERRLRIGDRDRPETPDRRAKVALLASAVVIALEAVLLAAMVAPAFVALALLALPLAWLATRPAEGPAAAMVETLRVEYGELALDAPVDWTLDAVRVRLEDLQQRLAEARLDQERSQRWASLADRRAQAAARLQELSERRRDLREEIGVVPEGSDPESIRQIASALEAWRDASDMVAMQRSGIALVESQIDAGLQDVNALLVQLHAEEASSLSQAQAVIDDVAERVAIADRLRLQIASGERQREEQILPLVERLQGQIERAYRDLGLEPGADHVLTDMCERVLPCREAQRAVERARGRVEQAKLRLSEAPGYLTKDRSAIDRELAEARHLVAQQQEIQAQFSTIKAELHQAKRRKELEDAVAEADAAMDALRERRAQDYASMVGWNLCEYIQGQHRMTNRPAVLAAADELFAAFTSGAYRLEIGEEGQPDIRAIDTTTRQPLRLEELSSGTRVQLLLAVRLAFIERSEKGSQMPILLDETLGNTDEVRACAIIDAAIEIARRGRQVFYFTAQSDEIAKWRSRVDQQPDAPGCRTFDLAELRGQASAARTPDLSWEPAGWRAERLWLPDDADHRAARVLLDVAPVNLRAEHIDGVDLWYLITDVRVLGTLRSRGVSTWGQYQQLYRFGSLPVIGSEMAHQSAYLRARVIETVREAWQHGRPRPLTRDDLAACDALTPMNLDRVADLCAELEGDGAALIQGLRDKKIARFHLKTIDRLEDFLIESGFITDIEPLPDEIIYARAMTSAQDGIDAGIVTEQEIADLLMSIGSVAAPRFEMVNADVPSD